MSNGPSSEETGIDDALIDACGPCLTFQRLRERVALGSPPEAQTRVQVSQPTTLTTCSKSFAQLIDFCYLWLRLAFPWPFAHSYLGVQLNNPGSYDLLAFRCSLSD